MFESRMRTAERPVYQQRVPLSGSNGMYPLGTLAMHVHNDDIDVSDIQPPFLLLFLQRKAVLSVTKIVL